MKDCGPFSTQGMRSHVQWKSNWQLHLETRNMVSADDSMVRATTVTYLPQHYTYRENDNITISILR